MTPQPPWTPPSKAFLPPTRGRSPLCRFCSAYKAHGSDSEGPTSFEDRDDAPSPVHPRRAPRPPYRIVRSWQTGIAEGPTSDSAPATVSQRPTVRNSLYGQAPVPEARAYSGRSRRSGGLISVITPPHHRMVRRRRRGLMCLRVPAHLREFKRVNSRKHLFWEI